MWLTKLVWWASKLIINFLFFLSSISIGYIFGFYIKVFSHSVNFNFFSLIDFFSTFFFSFLSCLSTLPTQSYIFVSWNLLSLPMPIEWRVKRVNFDWPVQHVKLALPSWFEKLRSSGCTRHLNTLRSYHTHWHMWRQANSNIYHIKLLIVHSSSLLKNNSLAVKW